MQMHKENKNKIKVSQIFDPIGLRPWMMKDKMIVLYFCFNAITQYLLFFILLSILFDYCLYCNLTSRCIELFTLINNIHKSTINSHNIPLSEVITEYLCVKLCVR